MCRTRKDIEYKVQSAHFQTPFTCFVLHLQPDTKTMHSKMFIIVSKINFLPEVNAVVGPNRTVMILLLISLKISLLKL